MWWFCSAMLGAELAIKIYMDQSNEVALNVNLNEVPNPHNVYNMRRKINIYLLSFADY